MWDCYKAHFSMELYKACWEGGHLHGQYMRNSNKNILKPLGFLLPFKMLAHKHF